MTHGKPPVSPKQYWFKRDRYGWGWVPVKWQGFAYIVVFFVIAAGIPILAMQLFDVSSDTGLKMVIALSIVMSLGAKSVAPWKRWRWGRTSDDNPEEDF